MKSILFLTPELPYPPFSGGRIKSWKLVEFLGEHYDLTVGCLLKGDDAEHLGDFISRARLKGFFAEPVNVPRSLRRLLESYWRRVPLNLLRSFSRNFAGQVARVAPGYDMIFSDHYEVFQYIPSDYAGRVVLHEHNAYYAMWERYARASRNPGKQLAAYLESLRVKRTERDACRRADRILAAPNDVDLLARIGVESEKCRVTYHLGDDTQLALPELRFANTEKALMYMGHLGWEANVDGLLWFFRTVWPGLRQRHGDLKFHIIGKEPDPRLRRAAADDPAVIFTGFVEDPEPYFRRSRLFIAPLRFGAGIKVKVLNAMCRGIPTVTTSVGAEGIRIENGTHADVADTPAAMEAAVHRLLTDGDHWETLSRHSRGLIRRHYTWERLFTGMKSDLDQLLEVTAWSRN